MRSYGMAISQISNIIADAITKYEKTIISYSFSKSILDCFAKYVNNDPDMDNVDFDYINDYVNDMNSWLNDYKNFVDDYVQQYSKTVDIPFFDSMGELQNTFHDEYNNIEIDNDFKIPSAMDAVPHDKISYIDLFMDGTISESLGKQYADFEDLHGVELKRKINTLIEKGQPSKKTTEEIETRISLIELFKDIFSISIRGKSIGGSTLVNAVEVVTGKDSETEDYLSWQQRLDRLIRCNTNDTIKKNVEYIDANTYGNALTGEEYSEIDILIKKATYMKAPAPIVIGMKLCSSAEHFDDKVEKAKNVQQTSRNNRSMPKDINTKLEETVNKKKNDDQKNDEDNEDKK